MLKIASCSLVAAVALVAGCATAAGSAGTGHAASTRASRPAATGGKSPAAAAPETCPPGQIGPVSASFVSPADGWLLGITLQDCWASGSSRIVARKTTDGGQHWSAVPAPPAPWGGGSSVQADAVSEILFAGPDDGWAFGPGLWATHDGGTTWRRIDTHGYGVYSMTATNGHVLAAFLSCADHCGRGATSAFTVETSPVRSDAWRPVPGAAGSGAPQLIAYGGTAYAVGADGSGGSPASVLTGPADGSAHWRRHVTPCPGIAAQAAATVTANSVVMACTLLGAHPATTRLYRTGDFGAHWRQVAFLSMYDGASVIDVAPDGTMLAGGIYNGIALSRDGGRTWRRPATVDDSTVVGGGGEIQATMTGDQNGFAMVDRGPFWITRDGGRTWIPVTLR